MDNQKRSTIVNYDLRQKLFSTTLELVLEWAVIFRAQFLRVVHLCTCCGLNLKPGPRPVPALSRVVINKRRAFITLATDWFITDLYISRTD